MIFNLIPCPPLDGFSIISEIFNIKHTEAYWTLYRYGDWILIGLIIFGITGEDNIALRELPVQYALEHI